MFFRKTITPGVEQIETAAQFVRRVSCFAQKPFVVLGRDDFQQGVYEFLVTRPSSNCASRSNDAQVVIGQPSFHEGDAIIRDTLRN